MTDGQITYLIFIGFFCLAGFASGQTWEMNGKRMFGGNDGEGWAWCVFVLANLLCFYFIFQYPRDNLLILGCMWICFFLGRGFGRWLLGRQRRL
jgi:hypothetical protein